VVFVSCTSKKGHEGYKKHRRRLARRGGKRDGEGASTTASSREGRERHIPQFRKLRELKRLTGSGENVNNRFCAKDEHHHLHTGKEERDSRR